jgi:hypothetical protein
VPRGWEIEQRDMVAGTVHRERQLAILIAGGNEFTAQPDGANYLTTAWPKGNRALAGAILPHQDGFESVDGSDFDWAPAGTMLRRSGSCGICCTTAPKSRCG